MMNEVLSILNRIKNMDYYEVVIPIPPQVFYCSGTIPFSFRISDDVMVCKVLASTYDEASRKVDAFLNSGSG